MKGNLLLILKRRYLIVSLIFLSNLLVSQDSIPINNPYAVLYNHLAELQDDNYNPESSALSFYPGKSLQERIKAAKMLKRIYDGKGLYVHVSRISKDSMYIDTIAEDHIYFPFPDQLPDIFVEKGDNRWYYSEKSLEVIPELYKTVYPFGLHRIMEMLPEKQGNKILGFYSWQLIALVIFFLFLVVTYYILSRVLNFILKYSTKRLSFLQEKGVKLIKKVDGYIVLAFLSIMTEYILPTLRLPIKFSFFLLDLNEILLTIFIMLTMLTLVNILKAYLKNVTAETETKLDEQLLPIVIKMLKIIIVAVAVFHVLHLLKVNVTTLIAGISIGGLALALAAQDTVKNLIGSMMIFFDKPFQIGDYIITDNHEGSVVEVGFRSTRIKKVDTSIISIPNGSLVNGALTNLGVRNLRILNMTLGLMYNSSAENIASYISDLKEYVDDHSRIFPENKYIHLRDLGASSIDIMFRVYIDTKDYADELTVKEEILFNVIRLAEKNNVSFAFPSSSVYIEQMPRQNK